MQVPWPKLSHGIKFADGLSQRIGVDQAGKIRRGRFPGRIGISDPERHVTVAVKQFWQNYPKSLEVGRGMLSVGLWPQDGGEPEVGHYGRGRYFFSGGWHKTHELFFSFSSARGRHTDSRASTDGLLSPLFAEVPPAWHAETRAWGLLAPSGFRSVSGEMQEALDRYERYQRILVDPRASSDGIDLEAIREMRGYRKWFSCEWYGWEDFGDLMHGGNPCHPSSLIYDWPYIMWLHYARSGDPRFRRVAEEMTPLCPRQLSYAQAGSQ